MVVKLLKKLKRRGFIITMIKIIGTDHLMKAEEIIRIIKEENPSIIGVELCQTRFNQMVTSNIKTQENNSIIGKISKEIAKKASQENLQYGSDQITASKYALENKIPLSLLDRDIIDISHAMSKIPLEEQIGFMKELQKFQEKTLTQQTKNINEEEVIKELKEKYPMAYEILIISRDLFITYRIQRLLIKFPNKKILCFLGKGHLKQINKLLELELEDERREKC